MRVQRDHRKRSRAVCLTVTLLVPLAGAQLAGSDRGRSASATLPESNEALLLSGRAEEAIQSGDYRLAMELSERLMALPDGLVAAPASRTRYPVWRQAFALLAQLPEPGVDLYRQLYDAEVEARFQQAVSAADVGELRTVFRGFRLSSHWSSIGAELAARLLDRGAFGEAIEVLRESRLAGVEVTPEQDAQLAVALAGAGALRSAKVLFDGLRSDATLIAQPGWNDRLARLDRWFAAQDPDGQTPAAPGAVFMPRIAPGAVWTLALSPHGEERPAEEVQDLALAVDILRRLPQHAPVLGGGVMVVRLNGRVWAVDVDTMVIRWSAAERPADGVAADLDPRSFAPGGEAGAAFSPDAGLLLSNHLRHAVSLGFERAYTVEGLTLFDPEVRGLDGAAFRMARESARGNELVARDLGSGRIVWRTSAEPAEPLYDVAFQNVPIVSGDRLVAPFARGKNLSLGLIDPADGRLIREVPLVGPPMVLTNEGGRCLIVTDETAMYVCTGNGVIAALAREDLSWKWATTYPSTLAEHLGQLWWQPARTTPESNPDQPLIASDLLVVAPIDSPDIFALDRFNGRERWRMPRRKYPFLIGATRSGLLLGGPGVACFDLRDPTGQPPRWRSVPLEITGRAAIRDDRVYVPTIDGVVVLDGQNGRVLTDQLGSAATAGGAPAVDVRPITAAAPERTGNLLLSDDSLFSVSTSRVVKYPDVPRLRSRLAAEGGAQARGDRATLMRSWLDALDGQYETALTQLQQGAFEEPSLRAARDHLSTYALLGMARLAPAGEDRLNWLQRAVTLADSPESATRLAVTIGQTLEDAGRRSDALRHYADLLQQEVGCHVRDAVDPDRRVAGWLHAAQRIRALVPHVSAAFADELMERTIQGQAPDGLSPTALHRLRVALVDEPARDRLDRLLTLQKLAPELKIQVLPRGDEPELPAGLRRRLHLERWDTHVSLGRMTEARADKAVWDERFAHSTPPPEPTSGLVPYETLGADEERDRVEAIDLAYRKLVQAGGQPFTRHVVRQWATRQAELFLDPRRPLTALRPWVLIADLNRRRIELINAYKHAYPQRQTDDALVSGRSGRDVSSTAYGRIVDNRRFAGNGRQPDAWPVVIHQELAAVPVRGGLVCVGLGPERYAGRRLWEFPVPEWEAMPAGFAERSVADSRGVYFTPRRDRVVLVGWVDGDVWWQRDLPGVVIERLVRAGEQLVIVSDDQRVWVTDATFGRQLRAVDIGIPTPRRVDVVDETILIWGRDFAAGISIDTLDQTWQRPSPLVGKTVTVSGQPWIAYQDSGERSWSLMDARSGKPVFDTPLGDFQSVSAIVVDRDRILVAGRVGPLDEDAQTPTIRLTTLTTAGERLWMRDFSSRISVNATQLAAHADLIPILLDDARESRPNTASAERPAIQLVDKLTGEPGEPIPIGGDYQPAIEASCGMTILATPTRIIVQVGGNLIAYGNSPLRSGP